MKGLAALLLLTACASSPATYVFDKEPQLGTVFPIDAPPTEYWMIASAQLSPAYSARFHDIDYVITVDGQRHINYIQTTDRHFVTREGLRVGNVEAEVIEAGGSRPVSEPGWARYARLQSGWCAMYGSDDDAKTVIAFFKR